MFDCIAVIGSGSAGMRHIEALKLEGLTAIAVPRRSERLKVLEDTGYKFAADLDGAIRAGARGCIVSTETRDHLKDAIHALERDLDVLVEKPMASGSVDAHAMNSAA